VQSASRKPLVTGQIPANAVSDVDVLLGRLYQPRSQHDGKRLVWCRDIVIQEWDVAVVGWKPGLQMALTVSDSGEPFLPPVFQIEVGVLPAHLGKQVPECIGEKKTGVPSG
jgi:hypothetical protein